MDDPKFLAAAIQMFSGEDKQANLARATELVEEAAGRGARLVVLPEFFNCLGHFQNIVGSAEALDGPTARAMSELASRLEIVLVAGSLCEKSDDPRRGFNTSLTFGPQGDLLGCYRKTHLFDVDVPGEVTVTESDWVVPGEEIVCAETPLGKLGLATCYDLRFPELFRLLGQQGMEFLALPSAFAQATGRVHWEVLLRARAIENQVYLIAADQYGMHTPNFTSYGCSMIVDPWGTILASAEEKGDAVVLAEIDLGQMAQVRRNLPALRHRRF